MFGNPVRIELNGFGVTLRPLLKTEMCHIQEYLQHLDVTMYTNMTFAQSLPDEEDWWEKARKNNDTVLWAIVPDGSDRIVGTTALHGIHPFWGSCSSGIIIGDKEWWGKGVAYRAHLIRTWYAVKVLNRLTIQSCVRVPNEASFKALLKVGYRVTGRQDRNCYRMGEYLDTYILSWVNPRRVDILYPDGAPEEMLDSLEKAEEALRLGDQYVKFI